MKQVLVIDRTGNLIPIQGSNLDYLIKRLSGRVYTREDEYYGMARAVWNGATLHKPALIACCYTEEEVQCCINFAREQGISFSVRGGGHNISGRGLIHDGFTIHLGAMNKVDVDPELKTVTVQGGALLRDVDTRTPAYNLAMPLGVAPTTGVTGLALGGGMGRLSRKLGLSCDNLLSARIILGTGEILKLSEEENSDLFWGIRGGGGNYGIVTQMTFQLHPIPERLLAGKLIFPGSKAREGLKLYRQLQLEGPDELGLDTDLVLDDQGRQFFQFSLCYNGPEQDARDQIEVFKVLGKPIANEIRLKTYPEIQHSDHVPFGRLYHYRSGFTRTLSDDLIDLISQGLAKAPTPSPGSEFFIACQQSGGAVNRVPQEATAFAHRDALCNVIAMTINSDPDYHRRIVEYIDHLDDQLQPHYSGLYANDGTDQTSQRTEAVFRENLQRLTKLKKKYDPDNLFNRNVNIKP